MTFPIFKYKLNPACNILFPVPELEESQDWFKSNSDFLILDGGWIWGGGVCVNAYSTYGVLFPLWLESLL